MLHWIPESGSSLTGIYTIRMGTSTFSLAVIFSGRVSRQVVPARLN